MNAISENIMKSAEDEGKAVMELIRERFFSPMYFYFGVAWVITNWKFVFTLLFTDETVLKDVKQVLKVEYLAQLYPFCTFSSGLWSISKLVIIPLASAFATVWWLSLVSEKFFRKYETYKMNKRTIARELDYTEKTAISKKQREIRDLESDKKELRYEDNEEYNSDFDDNADEVRVSGIVMRPSEVLYNMDYEAYKEDFNEWKEGQRQAPIDDDTKQKIVDEHYEEMRGQEQIQRWKDEGRG